MSAETPRQVEPLVWTFRTEGRISKVVIMSGEKAPTQPQQPGQEMKPEEPLQAAVHTAQESGGSPAAERTPLSCRALVLTGYGGYDKVKLQVKMHSNVQLKPREVLVRVKACGLNFAELMGRQGLYDALPSPPVTMGMEGSGVIEAVGKDVEDRKVSRGLLRTRAPTKYKYAHEPRPVMCCGFKPLGSVCVENVSGLGICILSGLSGSPPRRDTSVRT